jgi:hypothetical protein
MVKFGQSTRWFILNGPDDINENAEDEKEDDQPRKKIQIVSKK